VRTIGVHIKGLINHAEPVISTTVESHTHLPLLLPTSIRSALPTYWRSLYFFNVYRLIGATLLLVMVTVWSSPLQFGSRDRGLFIWVTCGYIAFSVLCFVLIRTRRRFDLQLSIQVASDVAAISILGYASQGVSSGLGLLLLTTLAAAGLVARGRLTLFYAAIASIAMLIEQTYEVLNFDASVAQYAQAGLLAAAYFAIAGVAHTLSKYAVASEELAAQREIDLENMAQVSQHVMQDMQDGVLVVDGKGIIRQFNTQVERIVGPLRGRRDVPLQEYAPALARRFEGWRNDELGRSSSVEQTIDGSVGTRFVPVGRRRSAGAVVFIEDLTRIQAEARQMKLAAMGRLTANIAHEIRNPLSAISHAAELLQEEPAINDTVKRLTTIIQDNSRRIDKMVNDVLRLRRGDSVHHERFKVADYLTTFVEQFCEIEKISHDIFKVELKADRYVVFDRSHLNQVMWNLCRNAVRHCQRLSGSIRVTVSTGDGNGILRLDVVDDGPGVPTPVRAQLFEPFFTTAAGGTGLGLYIAREVCVANGARLDYIETNMGAQFSVFCRLG
jgi:two-component system sensor histidine kinase PilS (NtrC family)